MPNIFHARQRGTGQWRLEKERKRVDEGLATPASPTIPRPPPSLQPAPSRQPTTGDLVLVRQGQEDTMYLAYLDEKMARLDARATFCYAPNQSHALIMRGAFYMFSLIRGDRIPFKAPSAWILDTMDEESKVLTATKDGSTRTFSFNTTFSFKKLPKDHPRLKLNRKGHAIARITHANGIGTHADIARIFGVSKELIQNIVAGHWSTRDETENDYTYAGEDFRVHFSNPKPVGRDGYYESDTGERDTPTLQQILDKEPIEHTIIAKPRTRKLNQKGGAISRIAYANGICTFADITRIFGVAHELIRQVVHRQTQFQKDESENDYTYAGAEHFLKTADTNTATVPPPPVALSACENPKPAVAHLSVSVVAFEDPKATAARLAAAWQAVRKLEDDDSGDDLACWADAAMDTAPRQGHGGETKPNPEDWNWNPRSRTILRFRLGKTRAVDITNGNMAHLWPGHYLNDTLIKFGLKYWLQQAVPNFYQGYRNVASWTQKIDLFDKKIIFVPINTEYPRYSSLHWYLAVIWRPDLVLQKQREVPTGEELDLYSLNSACVVILDSLGGNHPEIGHLLGRYLQQEALTRRGIPLASSSVPRHQCARHFCSTPDVTMRLILHNDSYDPGRHWQDWNGSATLSLRETLRSQIEGLSLVWQKEDIRDDTNLESHSSDIEGAEIEPVQSPGVLHFLERPLQFWVNATEAAVADNCSAQILAAVIRLLGGTEHDRVQKDTLYVLCRGKPIIWAHWGWSSLAQKCLLPITGFQYYVDSTMKPETVNVSCQTIDALPAFLLASLAPCPPLFASNPPPNRTSNVTDALKLVQQDRRAIIVSGPNVEEKLSEVARMSFCALMWRHGALVIDPPATEEVLLEAVDLANVFISKYRAGPAYKRTMTGTIFWAKTQIGPDTITMPSRSSLCFPASPKQDRQGLQELNGTAFLVLKCSSSRSTAGRLSAVLGVPWGAEPSVAGKKDLGCVRVGETYLHELYSRWMYVRVDTQRHPPGTRFNVFHIVNSERQEVQRNNASEGPGREEPIPNTLIAAVESSPHVALPKGKKAPQGRVGETEIEKEVQALGKQAETDEPLRHSRGARMKKRASEASKAFEELIKMDLG
ncbi:hypothetical protein C8F01DRAFT_1080164 [Mycena amicta]|nr:hypothetical protein C8F01DRAFT_1080164 [Mycena amicta]